ncbi:MAG: transcription/translation regulatory transformer protein RfaH [Cyanobacteria bacterium P01_F01_bin.3]
MLNWYAVQTKPRREDVAEQNLKRQGYDTYLPELRLRRFRRGKWENAVEPLFPRYLFIRADSAQQSLSPVGSTPGVATLVRFGHLLRPVPDSIIDNLRQLEDPDTHQHNADAWSHQRGAEVRVLAGSFSGLTGIFHAAIGEERALLLIELLGRQNKVTIPMDAIGEGRV